MVGSRLRRQRRRLRRIGEAGSPPVGRLVAARLVGRLHRVDGVEVGREVAVADELRDARRAPTSASSSASFSVTPSGSTAAIDRLGRALVGVRIVRRAGADQPLSGSGTSRRSAPMKKLSASVYFCAIFHSGSLASRRSGPSRGRRNRPRRRTCRSCRRRSASGSGRSGATGRASIDAERRVEALRDRRSRTARSAGARSAPAVTGGVTPLAVRPSQIGGSSLAAACRRDRAGVALVGDVAAGRWRRGSGRRDCRSCGSPHRSRRRSRSGRCPGPSARGPHAPSTPAWRARWLTKRWRRRVASHDAFPRSCASGSLTCRAARRCSGHAGGGAPPDRYARRRRQAGNAVATIAVARIDARCVGGHAAGAARPRPSRRAGRRVRRGTRALAAALGAKLFFDPRALAVGQGRLRVLPQPGARLRAAERAARSSSAAATCASRGCARCPRSATCRRCRRSPSTSSSPTTRATRASTTAPTGGLTWDGRVDRGRDQARIPLLSPLRDGERRARPRSSPTRHGRRLRPDLDARRRRRHRGRSDPRLRRRCSRRSRSSSRTGGLLSLHQQVRRLPRRQGELDAAGSARPRAVQRRRTRATAPPATSASRGNDGTPPQFTDFGLIALGVPRNPADPGQRRSGLLRPRPLRPAAHRPRRRRREYCGLFRTPTLRNVATRQTFFHNGVIHDAARGGRASTPTRDTDPGALVSHAAGRHASTSSTTCRRATAPTSTTSRRSAGKPGEPAGADRRRDRRRRRVPRHADRRLAHVARSDRRRRLKWWVMTDSNRRHPRCKRGALPAELITRRRA